MCLESLIKEAGALLAAVLIDRLDESEHWYSYILDEYRPSSLYLMNVWTRKEWNNAVEAVDCAKKWGKAGVTRSF